MRHPVNEKNQRFFDSYNPKKYIQRMIQQKILWEKLFLMVSLITLMSCAHRSGHGKKFAEENRYKVQRSNNSKTIEQDMDPDAIIRDQPNVRTAQHRHRMGGAEIFKRFGDAVFMVVTSDGEDMYQGSGFFIGKDGLAVSNYHVFKDTGMGLEAVKLAGDDHFYKVSHIYVKDEEHDFILFRVACQNSTYLPIADGQPQVGDKVFAIGSPRGLENTFSSGEVSQWRDRYLMQISALIDHGSSGGALVNEFGEVVGITSGTFAEGSQANLNYAWSIDVIKPYLRQ
jgi:serine protease